MFYLLILHLIKTKYSIVELIKKNINKKTEMQLKIEKIWEKTQTYKTILYINQQ